jgi:agmatine deiminase
MPITKKNTVTIGLIQSRVSTDLEANLKKTVRRIREAHRMGARVVCLQELFRTKYFPADEKKDVAHLAETIPGESTSVLSSLARELGVVIIAPVFEAAADRFFNSAAVIDADGTLLETYRKIHIPHDPFFYEQSYFEFGDTGYRVYKTKHLTFAVLICYDQWFPEAARCAALQGAEVIFYPTAIGYLRNDPLPYSDWLSAWTTIQRGHAIANSVHVAAVNRVGVEGEVKFWGSSFICDAFGKIIKKSGIDEEVLVADIDVSQNARIREGWRFSKNRRPETYHAVTEPIRPEIPQQQGYVMPAEWEPHQATWLAWPEDRITFPKRLEKVRRRYVDIIEILHRGEDVHLAVRDDATMKQVRATLKERRINLKRVQFYLWDYADVWFRDYGPMFVVDRSGQRIAIVQWRFNAWGEKYPTLLKDGHVPYFISEQLGLNLFRPNIVLEGGAIDVNGIGSLLTTEQCLLNPNRNPGLSKQDMERYLKDYAGVSNVIWLKSGIAGDDTDGHIDNLARFVNPNTVVCSYEENPADENHAALDRNYEILQNAKDQDGRPFRIVKLPMPPPMHDFFRGQNRRLSASYTNFYIANHAVLVPAFEQETDQAAQEILRGVFPGREVTPVDCRDLVYGAGTLHCITQQQPL